MNTLDPLKIFSFPFRAMGSVCEVRLYATDAALAQVHADAAQAEVRRLEKIYSRYLDHSVTTRINRSAGDAHGVEVDEETAGLLDYAQAAWEQSEGLFDISSGVLRRVWDFKTGCIPAQAEIDAMLKLIGWDKLSWRRPRLVLPLPGMELDFGGYVKEYAADRAAQACRLAGARHGFVELGGDIAVIGPHPDDAPWEIGIRHPRNPTIAIARIALTAGGIASSGDYERYFERDGHRYCHILNPLTGWPVAGLAGVSVVAEQCLIAGTASTIAMLKGRDDGPEWLAELGLRHIHVNSAGNLQGSLAVV
jgi:thiamine biosynthesis lipoprotein